MLLQWVQPLALAEGFFCDGHTEREQKAAASSHLFLSYAEDAASSKRTGGPVNRREVGGWDEKQEVRRQQQRSVVGSSLSNFSAGS